MLQILHLEDNLLDAELVEAHLLESGWQFEIERVETQSEFTAAVAKHCYGLILADYSLPSFDGVRALSIAREHCPEVPFIIISGALGEELAIETLKTGATDFVLKHRLDRLAPAVARALREAEERAARLKAERDLQDLLEREQEARLKAEEANRLKDEFLATVSHELRTPLNAIYGWAKLMCNNVLSDSDKRIAVEVIERNARAQIQLVEDLLDVSRTITGKLRLDIKSVDATSIIGIAIEAARPAATAKSIEIRSELDSSVKTIFADASRLQQIVWNLLSNAVKFTRANGRVTVGLRERANTVEISVTDTGEGIAPEFLPFVFERFRQAEQGTTRTHGGLGLGLAIVKNLVEMHGGSVMAMSEGVGRGATFIVLLPQTTASHRPRAAHDDNAAVAHSIHSTDNGNRTLRRDALTGLRILAVEDDADSRELLKLLLEQSGAQIALAASAGEAWQKLCETEFDLLISDLGMPFEDGYDLIKKIRLPNCALNQHISAVALTGFARAEDERRARQAGFDAHIAKPIEPANLISVITNVLSQK